MKTYTYLKNLWSTPAATGERRPESTDARARPVLMSAESSRPPRGPAPTGGATPPTLAEASRRILDDNGRITTSDLLHTGFKDEQHLADAFQRLRASLGMVAGASRTAVVKCLLRNVRGLATNPRKDLDAQVQALDLARALTRTLAPEARDAVACTACELARAMALAPHGHSFRHELLAAGRQYGAKAFAGKRKVVSVPLLPVTTAALAVGVVVKAASKTFKADKTANKALHLVSDAIRDKPALSNALAHELTAVFTDARLRDSQHVSNLRVSFAAKASEGQRMACNVALVVEGQAPLS